MTSPTPDERAAEVLSGLWADDLAPSKWAVAKIEVRTAIREAVAAERIRIQIAAEGILNVPLTEIEPVERLYKAHEHQNGWLVRSGAGVYFQDRWPLLVEAIRARGEKEG